MKTIRNQLRYPKGLQLPMLLLKGIINSWYSIFCAVKKRTTNRQQTKNQSKLNKAILWRPKYVRLQLLQTPIMYYVDAH